jgi:hypothetical protein
MIPAFIWPLLTAASLIWVDQQYTIRHRSGFASAVFALGALSGFLIALT